MRVGHEHGPDGIVSGKTASSTNNFEVSLLTWSSRAKEEASNKI